MYLTLEKPTVVHLQNIHRSPSVHVASKLQTMSPSFCGTVIDISEVIPICFFEVGGVILSIKKASSWWFQPVWNICLSKWIISPGIGVNKNYAYIISNKTSETIKAKLGEEGWSNESSGCLKLPSCWLQNPSATHPMQIMQWLWESGGFCKLNPQG